jgi:hypothetical protein
VKYCERGGDYDPLQSEARCAFLVCKIVWHIQICKTCNGPLNKAEGAFIFVLLLAQNIFTFRLSRHECVAHAHEDGHFSNPYIVFINFAGRMGCLFVAEDCTLQ